MSDVKWIKISTDIFDNWKIKQIKTMPEGYKMICVWFQLLCLCGKCNESGLIVLSGKVVANDELLSNIFGEDLKIIQLSLKTFEILGMIEITPHGATKISNWNEYQSVEGLEKIREYERIRKAKQREKRKEIKDEVCIEQVTNSISDSSISNSFSITKTNVNNLEYILNMYSSDYKEITDDLELLNTIKDWMEYKDQKRPKKNNHYDTERGIRMFLNKVLSELKKYDTQTIIEVINESIANNYQGITWDKLEKKFNRNTNKPSHVFDEWRDA